MRACHLLCRCVILLLAPAAASAETGVIRRTFTAADRAAGRYQYVPFEVPPGTGQLSLRLAYDRANGTNVVDLGLIEPGPLELGAARFRGWSGGARDRVEISIDAATPGYRAGPIPAGTWHAALGLYKVAPAGVEVTLTIECRKGTGPRWWTGDLHVHTEHSDGAHGLSEVARLAREAGLAFMAVTDHNNTTHARDRGGIQSPLLILGEEVTTPGGHANVWGLGPGEVLDFRVPAGHPGLADLLDRAHALGALVSINHPFAACDDCSWRHPIAGAIDAIEIWNGPAGPQEAAIALWDRTLSAGHRVTAVGGSDWHRPPAPIGYPSVRIRASALDDRGLLDAIRTGAVIVMRDPQSDTPQVTARAGALTASIGETLRVPSGDGVEVAALASCAAPCEAILYWNGERREARPLGADGRAVFTLMPPAAGRLRLHIADAQGVLAITNHIWIEQAARQ